MHSMTCWMSIYLTCICPELSTSLCYSAIGPAASIIVIVTIIDTCREQQQGEILKSSVLF